MPKSALILALLILVITGSVHSVAATSSPQPTKIEFSSVLDETRSIEQRMRAEIARDEKLQPDWDSGTIKAELDKAVRTLESSQTGDYQTYQKLRILSCQTPLLDYDLVKSANDMFQALWPWYHQKHVFWILSGNDTLVFLPTVPGNCRSLHAYLNSKAAMSHGSEIIQMVDLSQQCTNEVTKGDTQKANSYLWEVLKLAESSGDYELTSNVLAYYEAILRPFRNRPHQELYESKMAYVQQELPCAKNDEDFIAALDRVQKDCDPIVVQQLRATHAEMVAKRRSGERSSTNELCFKLIDLAGKAGDQTHALPYFALCIYHAYLSQDHSTKRDYDELRKQLFHSWVSEELGKQPLIVSDHVATGGDWKRMEAVFDSLEKQNVLVCRNVHLCRMWGESYHSSLLQWNPKPRLIGMVYYEWPNSRPDLFLECHGGSEAKLCPSCGKIHSIEKEPEPIVAILTKSLSDAGFKATTTNHPNIVRVSGDWHELDH